MSKRQIMGVIGAVIFVVALLLGLDATELLSILPDVDSAPVVTNPSLEEWYEIYFTDPTCPALEARLGGIDHIIAEDLSRAQESVDIAAFELDSEPIANALIALGERGIPVRVVIDEDGEDESVIRRMRRNGISVITDNRAALMHNKFIVIDETIVWTGSLNYTSNGAYCNNNNAVRFAVSELALNYAQEMDEMVESRLFGPDSPVNTPFEQIQVGNTRIENYFAPEREVAPILARTIASANESIFFLAFSFTDSDIGEAILASAEGGVQVRGVFESVGSGTEFSYYGPMRASDLANLKVRTDGNPRLMHHKVIIVDEAVVIFGSYNFSESASRSNDENVIIVHDPAFAAFFVEEFETVWRESLDG